MLYSWEAKPNPTAEQNLKKESHSKRYYYVCSYPVDRWEDGYSSLKRRMLSQMSDIFDLDREIFSFVLGLCKEQNLIMVIFQFEIR